MYNDKGIVVLVLIIVLMITTIIRFVILEDELIKQYDSDPTLVDFFFNPAYAEDPRVIQGDHFMNEMHKQFIDEQRFEMLQDSVRIYKLMSTKEGREWAFATYREYGEYEPQVFNSYFEYLNR